MTGSARTRLLTINWNISVTVQPTALCLSCTLGLEAC